MAAASLGKVVCQFIAKDATVHWFQLQDFVPGYRAAGGCSVALQRLPQESGAVKACRLDSKLVKMAVSVVLLKQ